MGILIGLAIIAALIFVAAKFGEKRHQDREEYARYLEREHGMYRENVDANYMYLLHSNR
jgi:hypothetical protein